MAGTWTGMNKVRPGAYMVFKGVRQANLAIGTRGVVVMPMVLPWGNNEDLIRVSAMDFVNGETLKLIGIDVSDPRIIPIREAFKNASTVLVGKLNANNTERATVQIDSTETAQITVTATHRGTLGNDIKVAVVQNAQGVYEIVTLVDDIEQDRQVAGEIGKFTPNGWITLSGEPDLVPDLTTGAALSGGTDGSTSPTTTHYQAFFKKASIHNWQVMAVTTDSATVAPVVKTYIENQRENLGKKVQAVVYNYSTANYEGIISIDQGYMLGDEVVEPKDAVGFVAGISAGANVNISNTYALIEGATSIINPKDAEDIIDALGTGKLVFSTRQDGQVVIEKDINTLHNFSEERTYIFSKNRVIRCLDDLATQITALFENSYIGKVNNNDSGRSLFKGDVIHYLKTLEGLGAIQNFDAVTDVEVLPGNDIESVIVNVAIQAVDAMEKMYMTVLVS
jgi:Phage tail sheath protein.